MRLLKCHRHIHVINQNFMNRLIIVFPHSFFYASCHCIQPEELHISKKTIFKMFPEQGKNLHTVLKYCPVAVWMARLALTSVRPEGGRTSPSCSRVPSEPCGPLLLAAAWRASWPCPAPGTRGSEAAFSGLVCPFPRVADSDLTQRNRKGQEMGVRSEQRN